MDPFQSEPPSSVKDADTARGDVFTKRTETVGLRCSENSIDETGNLESYSLRALSLDPQDPTAWTRRLPRHPPIIDQSAFKKSATKATCFCETKASRDKKRKTLPDIERTEYVCLDTSEPFQHEGEDNDLDGTCVDESMRKESQCIPDQILERFVNHDYNNRRHHTGRRRGFKPAASLSYGIEEARFKVPFPPKATTSDGIQNDYDRSQFRERMPGLARGDDTDAVPLEVFFHPAPRQVLQNNSNSRYESTLNSDRSCCNEENVAEKLRNSSKREKRVACDAGRRRRFKPASCLVLAIANEPEYYLMVPSPPRSAHNDGIQNHHCRSQPSGRRIGVSACKSYAIDAAQSDVTFLPGLAKSGEVPNESECPFDFLLEEQVPVSCIQGSFQKNLLVPGDEDKRPTNRRQCRKLRSAPTVTAFREAPEESPRDRVTLPPIHNASDKIQKYPPRHRPSGRMRRVGLCGPSEAAALTKERARARVLLKKFGRMSISN